MLDRHCHLSVYGIPISVSAIRHGFADPGQLFGLGPIQQLMGGGQGFQQPNAAPLAYANPNSGTNANNNANPGFGTATMRAETRPPATSPGTEPDESRSSGGNQGLRACLEIHCFRQWRFGDLQVHRALDRYRRAAHECPLLGRSVGAAKGSPGGDSNYGSSGQSHARGLEENPTGPKTNSASTISTAITRPTKRPA